MIDNRKILAIQLLTEGTKTNAQIAKEVGIGERTLYDWKQDEEFVAEWRRTADKFKSMLMTEGKNKMVINGQQSIDNIVYLANKAESEKIKLDANVFIYESIYGKATSKLDITAEAKQTVNADLLEAEFNEWGENDIVEVVEEGEE